MAGRTLGITMNQSSKEAKELFLRFKGSSFIMSGEGVLGTYKKFKVPKETEHCWMLERERELLSIVQTQLICEREYDELGIWIANYESWWVIRSLLAYIQKVESARDKVTRVRFASFLSYVFDMTRAISAEDVKTREECRVTAVRILKSAQSTPYSFSPLYDFTNTNLMLFGTSQLLDDLINRDLHWLEEGYLGQPLGEGY
jgi:hypothetical protein